MGGRYEIPARGCGRALPRWSGFVAALRRAWSEREPTARCPPKQKRAVGAMTAEEMARKLDCIKLLPADQLDGYEAEAKRRGFFDGEQAAIVARRKVLR